MIRQRCKLLFHRISTPKILHDRRGASTSSSDDEFFARISGRGQKTTASKNVPKENEFYSEKPEYPPIRAPFESRDLEGIKFEKREFADFVKMQPSVQEKLRLVSPYEREWGKREKTLHRDYMHPLVDPRTIFRVHAIPDRYNLLPFYQHITGTLCIDGLPPMYDSIDVGKELSELRELTPDLIRNAYYWFDQVRRTREMSPNDVAANIADQLTQAIMTLFGASHSHLSEVEVSRNSSINAFWVRSGFHTLYPKDEKEDGPHPKDKKSDGPRDFGGEMLGDDRRKFGEIAFGLRETAAVSVRHTSPLPKFVDPSDDLCRTIIPPYVYKPQILGFLPDKEGPIYMLPGFEYGEPHEFALLHIFPTGTLGQTVSRYAADEFNVCFEEALRSMSVAMSFSVLLGQAHYLGFTQHNDITYPLTTQTVLTDGQTWYFCSYQLNSIALLNHWEESERLANLAWCSGPVKLFERLDEDGRMENVNEDVLKLLLKFHLAKPKAMVGVEMRPYLGLAGAATDASTVSAVSQ